MKKFKIFVCLSLIFSAFSIQSCSEDRMDEINKNVNQPDDVESKYIISDVMVATGFSVTGSDLSFYTGVYAELNAGVDNQLYRAQTRKGEPQLATTYENSWNSIYRQLAALKVIIDKCSEGGQEEGNFQTLGIAQVLYAYNLAILTDLFGDVPYSDALKPKEVSQPKIDSQEAIYNDIFVILNNAIENLGKKSEYESLADKDVIYGGDTEKWIKLANGLLARYTMRLSFRKPNYSQVLEYVNKSFTDQKDEFILALSEVPNPFARFYPDRKGLATSKSFYELMLSNGDADVRTKSFFTELNGKVKPFDNSNNNEIEGVTLYSISGMMDESNPIYMFGYHELLFLKAEAEARLGLETEALKTLGEAVVASYTKKQKITFSSQNANNYVDTFGDLKGKDLLRKIMIEKYISFYENEGIEAYNDIRRLKAMGDGDLIKLVNPEPAKFPKRLPYGQSDVSANPNVKVAYGNGTYVYQEDVWWAGGTK